jgi:putative membrane protein
MTATDSLTDEARREIQAKIAEVEKTSAAEVVCAVATESGRYDRAESVIGLFVALLALSLGHALYSGSTPPSADEWAAARQLPLGGQAILVVLGFTIGSVVGSYWHALRRLLVFKTEMTGETERAAHMVFSSQRLRSTRDSGGVLVYVSLFEKQVRILADDGAMQALPADVLEQLTAKMKPLLKTGDVRGAFLAVLDDIGPRLAATLSSDDPDNENEIANDVLLFHPRL